MRNLEERIQGQLTNRSPRNVGILAKQLHFSPYKSMLVLDPDTEKLIPLEGLSAIVRNLNRVWAEDIQLRVYCWFRRPLARSSDKFERIQDGSSLPLNVWHRVREKPA